MTKPVIPHCDTQQDYSCENPILRYTEGGRYLRVSFSRSPGMEWNQENFVKAGGVRGVCKGFTFGSRRRMLDRLNQVSTAADLPDFITCTLPDDCFQDSVSEFAKTAKLHLQTLLKRVVRVVPTACGFWRIEWKARKSGLHTGKLFPHFHLMMWGLPQRVVSKDEAGKDILESYVPVVDAQQSFASLAKQIFKEHTFEKRSQAERFSTRVCMHNYRVEGAEHIAEKRGREHSFMSFFDWVSLAWYHVVGTGNVQHFMAGCRVEKIKSWGGVLSYCAKYMSKADAEGFLADEATGRNWGIFNRVHMPWAKMIELPLPDDAGIRLRRVMRRYLEHQTGKKINRHFGMTLYCQPARFLPLVAPPPDTPY